MATQSNVMVGWVCTLSKNIHFDALVLQPDDDRTMEFNPLEEVSRDANTREQIINIKRCLSDSPISSVFTIKNSRDRYNNYPLQKGVYHFQLCKKNTQKACSDVKSNLSLFLSDGSHNLGNEEIQFLFGCASVADSTSLNYLFFEIKIQHDEDFKVSAWSNKVNEYTAYLFPSGVCFISGQNNTSDSDTFLFEVFSTIRDLLHSHKFHDVDEDRFGNGNMLVIGGGTNALLDALRVSLGSILHKFEQAVLERQRKANITADDVRKAQGIGLYAKALRDLIDKNNTAFPRIVDSHFELIVAQYAEKKEDKISQLSKKLTLQTFAWSIFAAAVFSIVQALQNDLVKIFLIYDEFWLVIATVLSFILTFINIYQKIKLECKIKNTLNFDEFVRLLQPNIWVYGVSNIFYIMLLLFSFFLVMITFFLEKKFSLGGVSSMLNVASATFSILYILGAIFIFRCIFINIFSNIKIFPSTLGKDMPIIEGYIFYYKDKMEKLGYNPNLDLLLRPHRKLYLKCIRWYFSSFKNCFSQEEKLVEKIFEQMKYDYLEAERANAAP